MDNLKSPSNQNDPTSGSNSGQSEQYSPAAPKTPGDFPPVHRSGWGGWITGLVLILIGLIFLLQNFSMLRLNNWWALFLLIPAIGSFVSAYENYRSNQRITAAGRGPLIGGTILLFLVVVFLFGLDLGTLWPVFLVIGGLVLLLGGLMRN
jgi:hypothetical protein